MKVYLASANLTDIRWAADHHLIDGVLTTHELLCGAPGAESREQRERLPEIVRAARGTVFVTANAITATDVYRDARELAKLSDQIVVQVPFVEDVVDAIHRLAADGVKVAATLIFSPAQALLASRVGASAVVVPVDDLDGAGHDALAVLRELRSVLDGAACESDIVALRPATAAQFTACATAGADGVALSAEALRALLVHPLTDRGVDQALHVLSRQHASWSLV
jgi:transaldolase